MIEKLPIDPNGVTQLAEKINEIIDVVNSLLPLSGIEDYMRRNLNPATSDSAFVDAHKERPFEPLGEETTRGTEPRERSAVNLQRYPPLRVDPDGEEGG